MAKHGVYVTEQATSVSTPIVAESGVPFVIGIAPVQAAESPVPAGTPVLCTTWDEAVEKLGYSDDWEKYTICEFMYSHFKLYHCQPVVFCNVLDPATMKQSVSASEVDVADRKALLPIDAINDETLVVKHNSSTLTKGTDYEVYYDEENCIVEVLASGTAATYTSLSISYSTVKTSSVTSATISTAVENIELCITTIGTVPDLIVAPGFSHETTVAATMAAKAESINGLFKAKAIVDLDCTSSGATSYSTATTFKTTKHYTDRAMIVCWPMAKFSDKTFHMSTLIAGNIASVDTGNSGVPYESPSNKSIYADSLCLADGTEVLLTLQQANVLNAGGIATALNFINGWVAWGNYMACYPINTDVKDYFIPVTRMFAWVGNTLVKTFWRNLDKPMNRRLIETILDTANIWLNGLVGQGYLLGARVEMREDENPLANLMAGIIKLHVYITPPSPAQEIDFVLEYDADYVTTALMG